MSVLITRPSRAVLLWAWLAFIGALGPCLWRLLLIAGVDVGWPPAPDYRHGRGLVYLLTLVVLEATAAFLTLGLVQRWGERLPAWVPKLGGRRIHPRAALVPAVVGCVLAYAFTLYVLGAVVAGYVAQYGPFGDMHGWHKAFATAMYVPMALWPIGLTVAIVDYRRRRMSERKPPTN